MLIHEHTQIIGKVRLQKVENGVITQDTGFQENLITTVGKALMATLLGGSGTAPTYLAVGTSSTPATASDTTLGAEIVDSGLARSVASLSLVTTTTLNDTRRYTFTWTVVTNNKTIQEIGILNSSSAGTLLSHKIITAMSVIPGNQVIATYDIQFT